MFLRHWRSAEGRTHREDEELIPLIPNIDRFERANRAQRRREQMVEHHRPPNGGDDARLGQLPGGGIGNQMLGRMSIFKGW